MSPMVGRARARIRRMQMAIPRTCMRQLNSTRLSARTDRRAQESLLLNLLPPLFYLSIFVVVGLWLRPLLKDINVISDGAQRFAADYREPPWKRRTDNQVDGSSRRISMRWPRG